MACLVGTAWTGSSTPTRHPIDDRGDLSFAVVESSVDLVEEMARDAPVLLTVEDLHWADDLSLTVLAALTRRATVSRFGVIGSMRLSPRPPALDRLVERVREGLGAHVRLGSLDEVDVVAMASAITGGAPGEVLRERLRATAGNPLFITELLRSFDDEGLLRMESGVVDVTPGVTSADLHEVLVRRLSWLPTETRELLRLASLLGSAFTLHDLASITGRAVIDIAAWLREASMAGLIVGDGDRLAFRHDLIREAVYGHMLPAERRDLHRAAGQALVGTGAPTQQIAEQVSRGAIPGDLEAVSWLERAAVETISVSPGSALALLEQAVSLAPATWSGRPALQAQMIAPLAWCGRFDDAEAIATTVLAVAPDADVEFTALYGLSAVYGNRGDTASSITTLYRAAAVPGAPDDAVRRLRCLAAQLSLVTGAMSVEDARRVAEETLARSVADATPTTQCLAHQVLGAIAAVTGYGVAGREHLTAALALLDSGRVTADTYLIPDIVYTLVLLELDAIVEAIEAADNGRKRAERSGAVALLPLAYVAAANARLYAGRWDDAVAEVEAGLAVVEDTGSVLGVLSYDAILAKIAIHRGDLPTAKAHLEAGTKRFAEGVEVYGVDLLFAAQAEFLAASGQPEAASRSPRRSGPRPHVSGISSGPAPAASSSSASLSPLGATNLPPPSLPSSKKAPGVHRQRARPERLCSAAAWSNGTPTWPSTPWRSTGRPRCGPTSPPAAKPPPTYSPPLDEATRPSSCCRKRAPSTPTSTLSPTPPGSTPPCSPSVWAAHAGTCAAPRSGGSR